MAAPLKPVTVLVPANNMPLIRQAAAQDGYEKLSVYLRNLINRDLRNKRLLTQDEDITLHEVVWIADTENVRVS